MSTECSSSSSLLLLSDVNRLNYRQLQLELKSRHLKAAGKTEILRERLRQALLHENRDDEDYLEECSICFDKLSLDRRITITTTCSHRYHRICLKKWIESNGENCLCCPLCRRSLADDRDNKQSGETKFIV